MHRWLLIGCAAQLAFLLRLVSVSVWTDSGFLIKASKDSANTANDDAITTEKKKKKKSCCILCRFVVIFP